MNKWGLSCAKLRKISLCLIWCDLYYLSIIWKNELFRRLHLDPSPLISVRNCSIFISLLLPPTQKKNHYHPNFYKTPYLFFYSCYLCTALKIWAKKFARLELNWMWIFPFAWHFFCLQTFTTNSNWTCFVSIQWYSNWSYLWTIYKISFIWYMTFDKTTSKNPKKLFI